MGSSEAEACQFDSAVETSMIEIEEGARIRSTATTQLLS